MKERRYHKTNTEGWEYIDTFLVVDRPFEPAKTIRKGSQNKQNKEENTEQES